MTSRPTSSWSTAAPARRSAASTGPRTASASSADQGDEADALERGGEELVAVAADEHEALVAVLYRHDEPPAARELRGERGGDRARGGRRDVDRVERRLVRQA